jgi:hypothetical protein
LPAGVDRVEDHRPRFGRGMVAANVVK